MTVLWALLFAVCFLNFTITGFYYGSLPDSIPLILKFTGEPAVVSVRSVFTAFRMPMMMLIAAALCCTMWHNVRKNIPTGSESLLRYNDRFWGALAFVSVFKMSAEWLPFAAGIQPQPRYLMISVTLISVIAAALFLYYAFRIYETAGKAEIKRISSFATSTHKWAAIMLIGGYFSAVLLPVIFR